jgi:ATP-binding cassette subfamily F protein uup
MYADYSQWEAARESIPREGKPGIAAARSKPGAQKKRLSYMEGREWETIEARILAAEQELAARESELQAPEVTRDPERMQQAYERLQAAQILVTELYERWAELEQKQA